MFTSSSSSYMIIFWHRLHLHGIRSCMYFCLASLNMCNSSTCQYISRSLTLCVKQVSHHPTLIACHCEGRGWKFWADTNIHSKFWGRSIQLDPVGVLTLEFSDGEIFQWSKVCIVKSHYLLLIVYILSKINVMIIVVSTIRSPPRSIILSLGKYTVIIMGTWIYVVIVHIHADSSSKSRRSLIEILAR